jgi:hypothetical protein
VKRLARAVIARLTAPVIVAVDARLAQIAAESAEAQHRQQQELARQLAVDLRIVDESLLAVERAVRRLEAERGVEPSR